MRSAHEQHTEGSDARLLRVNPSQLPPSDFAVEPDWGGAESMAWAIYPPGTIFRFFAVVCRDEDRLSGEVPALPGVYAFGSRLNETIARLQDAVAAAIESYMSDGLEVPWQATGQDAVSGQDAVFAGWLEVHV